MSSSTCRNYLITGGARGIGRGLSRLLLSSGHRVFILDHNAEELAHITTRRSKSHTQGRDFEAVSCDLRKPSEISSAVEQARKLFDGRLDVLINNAGSGSPWVPIEDSDTVRYWGSLTINVKGPYLFCHAFLPLLQKTDSIGV